MALEGRSREEVSNNTGSWSLVSSVKRLHAAELEQLFSMHMQIPVFLTSSVLSAVCVPLLGKR